MTTQEQETVEYCDGIERPAHSDKGASGAERWMNCVGSSAVIEGMDLPQSDEEDYRREGVAGHEAAADCLSRDIDTWEIVGERYHNTEITANIADAVQMYLDRVRPSIQGGPSAHRYSGKDFFIEARLAAPEIHAKMFGSVDFGALVTDPYIAFAALPKKPATREEAQALLGTPYGNAVDGFLDVTDLKMGVGIEVDAYDNAQMKYYAFMLIVIKFPELDDDFPVRLTIVQPRCFSVEGPIRDWWTTVGEIKAWVVRDLLPAMNATDGPLKAGDWCRFCPAKLVCPLLTGLFRAAANYDPKAVSTPSDEAIGLSYDLIQAVKFYIKAVEEETMRRLNAGHVCPGAKLVNKKANRIFKEHAQIVIEGKPVDVPMIEELKRRFGAKAFTDPEPKSPAQIAELPGGKEFVSEYAYMPVTGLTVAREDDRRTSIVVAKAEERFAAAISNLIGETNE